MTTFQTHSSNLEELDISNITTSSRDPIPIHLEKFQKGCGNLRVLNANHTMLALTETPVREQVHSPGFPKLRELYIAVDSRYLGICSYFFLFYPRRVFY